MSTEIIIESAAETAKKIRKALKKAFPDLPARHFSVRTSTYSGGSSVRVSWVDYPSEEDVNKVTRKFSSSTFDGMTDYEDTHGYVYEEDGKRYNGADYVLTSRDISEERDEAVRELIEREYETPGKVGSHEWRMKYQEVEKKLGKDNKIPKKDDVNKAYSDFRSNYEVSLENVRIVNAIEDAILSVDLSQFGYSNAVYGLIDKTYKGGKHFNKLDGDTRRWIAYRVFEGGSYKNKVKSMLVECKSEEEFNIRLSNATRLFAERALKELCESRNEYILRDAKVAILDLAEEYRKKLEGNKEYEKEIVEKCKRFSDKLTIGQLEMHWVDYVKTLESIREDYAVELLKVKKKYERKEKEDKKKEVIITESDLKIVTKIINEQAEKEGARKSEVAHRISAKGLIKLKKEHPDGFETALKEELERVGKNKNKEHGEENKKKSTTRSKTGSVNKEYANVRTLTEEVMKYLLAGEVQLQFTKANGDIRDMRATRSTSLLSEYPSLAQAFKEGNSKENVGTEINQGTVSVVDLDIDGGGARKFVTERLISYQPKGRKKVVVSVKKNNEQGEDNKHFNPLKLSTEEMIKILSKKVVRLVFEKKDGSKRAMVATRNPNIVRLYVGLDRNGKRPVNNIEKDKEKDIETQIQKDYVKVLDVEKQAFRTFKPSKVVRYDEDLDMSSWVEFTENNDAWYEIALNGKNPKDYYKEGSRVGVNIGKGISERFAYEREQEELVSSEERARETLERSRVQAEEKKKRRNEKRERLKEVHEKVMNFVKETEVTKEFERIYKEILRVPRTLKQDRSFNNMENEITKVKKSDKSKLMIIQIWHDYIYLHPLFIVNGYSGNVYVDRTPDKIFSDIGEVRKSDADWGSEDVLEPLVKKIKALKLGTRRKKEKKEMSESNKKRNERLLKLGNEKRNDLAKTGVRVSEFRSKGENLRMLKAQVGNRVFIIHPDFVVENIDSKAHVVFKCGVNARVTGFKEFFSDVMNSADSESEVVAYRSLGEVVLRAVDLRKRVS